MSTYKMTMFFVACDHCDTSLNDDSGCLVHLDNEDDAIDAVVDNGWVIAANGDHVCYSCWESATCATRGAHKWSNWKTCDIASADYTGTLPQHYVRGSGICRHCRHDGCEEFQLAIDEIFSTIDEPTVPGR